MKTFARPALLSLFGFALLWAQFRESGLSSIAGHLDLITERRMPVRVYLFKDGKPFRFSPVDAMLPLRVDLFYRERLWRSDPDPKTLEVTCSDQSHTFLLKGSASFDLPPGKYTVEAYRGLFYIPVVEAFELKPGVTTKVTLKMQPWAAGGEWISADDHIHLTRSKDDDGVFLRWLEAEDLSVGNFLQLQRQMDASVQYDFGRAGEARRGGYSIRPGHESRSEYYGHVNVLGGNELIRPLSLGTMYANTQEAYPFPALIFARGRDMGGIVGYAHFSGSTPHSTQLMDLVLGNVDFIEVFQFGVLKTEAWYELLNAGLRVTGIAGSDFPVPLNRTKAWPRWVSLLGPERTLVKAPHNGSPYEAWAAGVRDGKAVVSNGPLVEMTMDEARTVASAKAQFFRPLEKLEIVVNGRVAASAPGDGMKTSLSVTAPVPSGESVWVAARVQSTKEKDEPEIQAHTNPVYVTREGKPLMVHEARQRVAARWDAELNHYKNASLTFSSAAHRKEFFDMAEKALAELRRPLAGEKQ